MTVFVIFYIGTFDSLVWIGYLLTVQQEWLCFVYFMYIIERQFHSYIFAGEVYI